MTALALRDYQVAALVAIRQAEQRGVNRQLVALPTGTGKTVIFSHLIQQRGGRTLLLAHRDELLRQAADKLLLVDPSADIGIVKADEDQVEAQTVVASIQTAAQPHRLARLGRGFDTIIVDEAHHAAADTYRRVLAHCGAFDAGGPLLVGFTATPERGDKIGLHEVFEEIVYRLDLLPMIQAGYLSDLRAVQIQLEADFSGLQVRAGDFIERELEAALMAAGAPEQAVEAYQEHAAGRKAIIFTPTVAVAHAMAEAFVWDGIAAAALDGATPTDERRDMLARFGRGDLQVIANCGVLTEGFDEPSVDCIIVARPTRSRPLYVQMIGRGTRPYPGKADCLVIDLVGVTARHDLVSVASLFNLPARRLAARTVSEAIEDVRRADEQEQVELSGRLVAVPVELFRQRRFNWIQAGQRFVLSLGGGSQIVLEPRTEGWAVLEQRQGDQRARIKAFGLPLDYAQGAGEDLARSRGAAHLVDREAPWRQRPASEKQIAVLRRWRVGIRPGLTAGEASDQIASAVARNSFGRELVRGGFRS